MQHLRWNLFFVLIVACGQLLAVDKVSTEQQAITRAQAFMRAVGWKTSIAPLVRYPSTRHLPNAWVVKYIIEPGHQEIIFVEVDKKTGRVQWAWNRIEQERAPETKAFVSPKVSLAKAKKVIAVAGISLHDMRLILSQSGTVEYRRYYAGYPVMEDVIEVKFNPHNAMLLMFCMNNRSPLPASTAVLTTEDVAKTIATNYLQTKKLDFDRIDSTKLVILTPNNYFERPIPKTVLAVSRLAWVVHFIWNRQHVMEVWVDAENGKVLGGVSCD